MRDAGDRVDIRVITRARTDEVGGERDGRLLVRTRAVPVDGKANEAVRRLLATHLGVRTAQIEIVAGQRSRDKTILIHRK
ncbi:MAG: DUF167 domain-containing protein [Microthrixaceae bacterium]